MLFIGVVQLPTPHFMVLFISLVPVRVICSSCPGSRPSLLDPHEKLLPCAVAIVVNDCAIIRFSFQLAQTVISPEP